MQNTVNIPTQSSQAVSNSQTLPSRALAKPQSKSEKAQYRNEQYKYLLAEIRKALAEARVTQSQIGEALGIKQSAVSTLLSGKSRMSIDQFFILTDLVGVKPQNLLQNTQNNMTQVIPMSPQIEATLYKSEVHLMAYCAAVREIGVQDLLMSGTSREQVQKALDELVSVELLVKKKNKYIQKNLQAVLRPSTRFHASRVHQQIVRRSWDLFDRMYANKAFIATKFNAYIVDRFSVAQTKEIEATLWKVFEKVQAFRQHNQTQGYTDDDLMPLWNLHLMLMTPLDPQ